MQIQCGNPARFHDIDRTVLQELIRLNKTSQEISGEMGCDVLFLVYNMLSWTGEKEMCSPLLLMAVSLECDVERGCLVINPREVHAHELEHTSACAVYL